MSAPSSSRAIAIVGGGLSGALVAVHLLRLAPPGTHIVIVERHPPIGRGVAYGTDRPEHLLNVPVNRLSAWPDDPDHFLRWVRERLGRLGYPDTAEGTDFLPRSIFGDYIAHVFTTARQEASRDVRLESIAGEVIDIEERAGGKARIVLADTRTFEVDRVVLALGNLPGEYPIRKSLRFYHGRHYVHTPWNPDVLEGIRRTDDVLIVGQGLTGHDIIAQLDQLGHVGTIHALSRRGLRPKVHEPAQAWPPFLAGHAVPRTVRALLHAVRAEVRKAEAAGVGWRAVIDALRPQSPELWTAFSWEERSRFMRHVRPYWEIHRHRIPPPTAALIDRRVREGRLKFYAGSLESLAETPDGYAQAIFRRRGTADWVRLKVAKVINCTGSRSDYSKYQHPLLINLLARGLIDHDPLALGIHAMPGGEVFRYRDGLVGWLYTLGAPLKGVLWECTAVPEIRSHALSLARVLLAS